MTPEQMVSKLRTHVTEGKTQQRPHASVDLGPDDGPPLELWEYCKCTEHGVQCGSTVCRICDQPINRYGGYYWHVHGRSDHRAVAV
jgi:hypothetical protein